MTLSTPSGMPARRASSAAASAVSGGELGRLDHDRAAGGQRGRNLARDHRGGKFQGVIAAQTPIGCLSTSRRRLLSNCGSVSPLTLGFLGVPLDEARAVGDLARVSASGLPCSAVISGQVFLVRHQQLVPAAQDDAAFLGGLVLPAWPGGVGGGDRGFGIGRPQVRDIGQLAAGGGSVTSKRELPATHWPLMKASVLAGWGLTVGRAGRPFLMSMVVSGVLS